jgi:septal ring factor EnvC (AmiA/AmiB activator)
VRCSITVRHGACDTGLAYQLADLLGLCFIDFMYEVKMIILKSKHDAIVGRLNDKIKMIQDERNALYSETKGLESLVRSLKNTIQDLQVTRDKLSSDDSVTVAEEKLKLIGLTNIEITMRHCVGEPRTYDFTGTLVALKNENR